jgi:hypothetical protein
MRKFINLVENSEEELLPWFRDGKPDPDKVNEFDRPHNWADDVARELYTVYSQEGKEAAEKRWVEIQEKDKPKQIDAVVAVGRFGEMVKANPMMKKAIQHNTRNRIWKSTWTEWQDRNGIFLNHQGSNSVYVGFSSQEEAEQYAADLGPPWKVIRNGRYKTEHNDYELLFDPEIRRQRMLYNMTNPPLVNLDEAKEVWANMSKLARHKVIDSLPASYQTSEERTYAAIKTIAQDIEKYR